MKAASIIFVLTAVCSVNGTWNDGVETESKRFLMSQNGWLSWMQKVACLTTCVSGFEPMTTACCNTGDNQLCQHLPFALLNNSIGSCPAIIPCTRNPCQYGICIDTSKGFQCTCQAGYAGKLCDTVDACTSSPCSYGVCSTLINGSFICSCSAGFTGRLCDKDRTYLEERKAYAFEMFCMRTLLGLERTTFRSLGNRASHCAIGAPKQLTTISPCSSNPCVHGVCSVSGNEFRCTCQQGYYGVTCDTRDPCSSSPCRHGTCFSSTSGEFMCSCFTGYKGTLCDTAICVDSTPAGTCKLAASIVCQDVLHAQNADCSHFCGYC